MMTSDRIIERRPRPSAAPNLPDRETDAPLARPSGMPTQAWRTLFHVSFRCGRSAGEGFFVAPRSHEGFQTTPGNRHGRNDAVILGYGYPLTNATGCRLFALNRGFRMDRAIGPIVRCDDRI